MSKFSPPAQGHLAMLAFSALVAGSFSLGALAAPLIAPEALTLARFALAGVAVGLVAALGPGLSRRVWVAPWRYLVLGALLVAYFVLMFRGLQTARAVPTAAIFTLTPVMAAGFGWVILRQGSSARMGLALALGAFGALWVIFRGDLRVALALQVGRGEILYFCGCLAHAIYAPLVRRLNRGESALTFTFGTLVAGFAILTAWGAGDVLATDWANLPAIVWICLAYVALAASALSFVVLQFAALRLPAAKVMAYTYLVPAWVILWEMALGRGHPPANVLGGIALTLLALALLLGAEPARAGPRGEPRATAADPKP